MPLSGECALSKYSMMNPSRVESVAIDKGVKKIEWRAFGCCTSLTTGTLPIGVNKIDGYVFYNCRALATIYVPAKKTDYYKQRLHKLLHDKIVELAPEKKTKK